MKKYILLIISFILLSHESFAAHIIGGEITYECLGNDRYRFTMIIYRDCQGGGAEFDGAPGSITPATITFFRGTSNIGTLDLENPIITPINPNVDNPCLIIPPGVCVEQGIYIFERTLEASNQSYHITYQRCCRNNSISNIVEPATSGATYTVELRPEAQNSCNNSPVFNAFPPIIICAGEPLDFDHSASDSEGDQLVYSFCSPILGGGTGGVDPNSPPGAASSLMGVAPDPDAPPPYDNVGFILPTYSALNPMGGAPTVNINPNTGIITGTPTNLGQFVVGVCVQEYRSGVLLSTIRRDFQFNVADCEPTVFAAVEHDSIIGDREFLINLCGDSSAILVNQSVQQQFINEYWWEFVIDSDTVVNNAWNPEVSFPGEGTYEALLILNPGTTCGDSAKVFINVFPEIVSDFEYEYDTCVAGPVTFEEFAYSGSKQLTNWNWTFGDGNASSERNPTHIYSTPGFKSVTLEVTDINTCKGALTQTIHYVPAPAEVIVEPSTFLGCVPGDIFFNNISTPIDDTYEILWDFGDGTTSGEISPSHIYETPGIYSVTLDITSPIGCYIGDEYPNWITVRESPEAGFRMTPEQPSNIQPTVTFTDQSQRAVRWDWIFGDLGNSIQQNPVFTFPDTGFHEVVQIVTHENGCQDTAFRLLDIEPQIRYFLPNAFTPNNDTSNDLFKGAGIFEGMTEFELTIWNRWGELIFETNDPNEGWNGTKNNSGEPSPNGVYVCVVRYVGPRNNAEIIKTYATLIR